MLTAVPITFNCAGNDVILDEGASALVGNLLIPAVVAGKLGEDSMTYMHAIVKNPITSLSLAVVAVRDLERIGRHGNSISPIDCVLIPADGPMNAGL